MEIDATLRDRIVVDWQSKPDAQNAIKNALEDRLIENFEAAGREVPLETIDFILDKVLQAARHHYAK